MYRVSHFVKKSNSIHVEANNNSASNPLFKQFARKTLVLGTICLFASGCTLNSQVADLEADKSIITGSVTQQVKPEGIDETDAELIKLAVVTPENQTEPSNLMAWSNPETGNKGTITAIDDFVGTHGQNCKKFRTTVDSFMGISLYNGETCELRKGFWVLSWFLRDKAA